MNVHGLLGGFALVGVIILTAAFGAVAVDASTHGAAGNSAAVNATQPIQTFTMNRVLPYSALLGVAATLVGLLGGLAALSYRTGLIGGSKGMGR